MPRKLLVANGTVVTLGEPLRVIPDGAVLIDGNVIEAVGRRRDVPADGAAMLDAGGGVIMPGFINIHTHLYGAFACGMPLKAEPPSNFVEILQRLWWRLDKALTLEDVRVSALVGLCRCLRAGATTIVDHHASPSAVRGSLDVIAAAARQVGVRACLCYEVSDRDGPDVARRGIAENVAFARTCRAADDAMVAAMIGMHASMTIGPETMAEAVEAARALDLGVHVHVNESRFDPEDALTQYGKRVVHRLADAGALGPKTIAAHCIHLDETEIERLRETGTNVAHNPQSNMNNAVGAADVLRILGRGVTVGLGSDGMTANMLDELRAASLIHKHVAGDPRVAYTEAVQMLTRGNGTIASKLFGKPVGALMPGGRADLIVLDYDPPTPLTEDGLVGHLLFGLPSARVVTTIVDGAVRYRDGRVQGIDERQVMAEARQHAAALWRRF